MKSKNFLSVLLVSSIALSAFTGCTLNQESSKDYEDDILDLTNSFCTYLSELNYKKISKTLAEDVSDRDLQTLAGICNYATNDEYTFQEMPERLEVFEAVVDSIEYSVDEDSLEIKEKKGKAEVDVSFTYLDVSELVVGDLTYDNAETAIEALESADSKEVNVTLNLVLEDDDWKVSDISDAVSLYDFITYADMVGFNSFVDISELFAASAWKYADENSQYLANTNSIDLELYFAEGADTSAVTWDCRFNGVVVCTGTGSEAIVLLSNCNFSSDFDGSNFPTGEYEIRFYDGNGNLFYSDTTLVNPYIDSVEEVDISVVAQWQRENHEEVIASGNASEFEYINYVPVYSYELVDGSMQYVRRDAFIVCDDSTTFDYGGTSIAAHGDGYINEVFFVYNDSTTMQEVIENAIDPTFTYVASSYAEDYGSALYYYENANGTGGYVFVKIDELGYLGDPGVYYVQVLTVITDSNGYATGIMAGDSPAPMHNWLSMTCFDTNLNL